MSCAAFCEPSQFHDRDLPLSIGEFTIRTLCNVVDSRLFPKYLKIPNHHGVLIRRTGRKFVCELSVKNGYDLDLRMSGSRASMRPRSSSESILSQYHILRNALHFISVRWAGDTEVHKTYPRNSDSRGAEIIPRILSSPQIGVNRHNFRQTNNLQHTRNVPISFGLFRKIELEAKKPRQPRGFSSLTSVTPMNGRFCPQILDETALFCS